MAICFASSEGYAISYFPRNPGQIPNLRRWVAFRTRWPGALSDDERRFEFVDEWEPTIESKAKARKRILRRFKKRLDESLTEAAGLARERQFEKPPRQPRELDRNLRWVIRFQVIDENFTDIARHDSMPDPEGSARRKISDAVEKTAELIGLTLRERDKGAVTSS